MLFFPFDMRYSCPENLVHVVLARSPGFNQPKAPPPSPTDKLLVGQTL